MQTATDPPFSPTPAEILQELFRLQDQLRRNGSLQTKKDTNGKRPARTVSKRAGFNHSTRAVLALAVATHPDWTSPADAYAWLGKELAVRVPFSTVDAFCRSKGFFPAHFRSRTRFHSACDTTTFPSRDVS